MSTEQLTNPFDGHALPSPSISDMAATDVLRSLFGRSGRLTSLGSHQDQNWRVDAADGRYVLKVSNPGFPRTGLEAQNEAMLGLAKQSPGFDVPVPVPSVSGELIPQWPIDGVPHDVRLVTFVDGRPLADFDYLAPEVVREHGRLAARAAVALDGFEHPGIDRLLQWDTRHAFDVVDALEQHLHDPAERALVRRLTNEARASLEPLIPQLRAQVVHADVTDVNVVATVDPAGRPRPTGLIDFGDFSRTWIASDVATAVVGLVFHDLTHPLQLARDLCLGYHEVLQLSEAEIDAVWPLVVARAAVCVVSSAQQVVLDPHSGYAAESLEMDRANLTAIASVPPSLARECLRAALGVGPAHSTPARTDVVALVDAATSTIDLSVTSLALPPGGWHDSAAIHEAIASTRGSGVTVSAYGEARLIDARPDSADESATVHLGVDVFASAGAVVRAPVAATVVASSPLTLQVDGGWLVLHGVDAPADVGAVAAGAPIGLVTDSFTALPPHVHVQLLTERVDAPLASAPSLADAWQRVCPNPSAFVVGAPAPAASRQSAVALLARRDAVVAGVQEHYYAAPPQIERGWRQHLFDVDGRAYLDMVNNVAVLGHSHPAMTHAVSRQLSLLNTNSRFHYGVMVEFAERLAATLPDPLDTVFLVNSGSEAVDLALRLARTATGRDDVIAVQSAYHGWTIGTDAITTSTADNPNAATTRPSWVHTVESPNPYRGQHRGPDAGARYADDVQRVVNEIERMGNGVACFIAECLYGNAGGVLLPDGYLSAAYRIVRDAGGVCIADEVQVGYGRTGHYFWAFQQQGVVPDLVTVAKAAGNGMAVGAVVTTRAVADAFAAQGSFFSSVGGSPVSATAGLTVLDVIESERLRDNAREIGDHLRRRLLELQDRHSLIGAVHGLGLYLGVELVRDRETLEPATAECQAICERMRLLGVIVQPTSDHLNVLKIKPPLCLTQASADFFVDTLDQVLTTGW
jgi:4-aminobutyrate aminotransferase-like enzyme/Ser/Thr protein kinase RdoA (MazF antagonist)